MSLNAVLWDVGTDSWTLTSTVSAPQPTLYSALKSEIVVIIKGLMGIVWTVSIICECILWRKFCAGAVFSSFGSL